MTFLSSPTRGVALPFLTETGNVLSGTVIDDGGGGGTVTTTAGGTIPCRIDALGGNEAEIASRISDRSTHLVTLIAGTPVTTDNDFSIDNRGTFEVTAVREYTNELSRAIEVVART